MTFIRSKAPEGIEAGVDMPFTMCYTGQKTMDASMNTILVANVNVQTPSLTDRIVSLP